MDHRTIMLELLKLKQHHAYLVDVSWNRCNPVHRAILFMGFWGTPEEAGNYTEVYVNNYDGPMSANKLYYMKVVRELCTLDPEDSGSTYHLPDEPPPKS